MAGNQGLSPNDIVNVTVSLSAAAVQGLGLGVLLILGSTSGVIDNQQRFRTYSTVTAVSADFGTTAPEYLAAVDFFAQRPQPTQLQIGFWAETGTVAKLYGQPLTPAQQALSNFTGIVNGSLQYVTGTGAGTNYPITSINLSGATSMASVASIINLAYSATYANTNLTISWDSVNSRFVVTRSDSPGATCTIQLCTGTGTGTNVAPRLFINSGTTAYIVNGIAAETPQTALNLLRTLTSTWYAVHFAVLNPGGAPGCVDSILTPTVLQQCAIITQAFTRPSIFLTTTMDPNALLSTSSTDLAALLATSTLNRSFCQFSSTDGFAACAAFATMATINYSTGAGVASTMKFKQLLGITPEVFTETGYATLYSKNCNAFCQFSDNLAIEQEGIMGDGTFFDEIQSTDALSQDIQTSIINTLVLNNQTKVPQTDEGMHTLIGTVDGVMAQYVSNGTIGEGLVWAGGSFGTLTTGDTLPSGWYIYQQLLNLQPAANRALRQAPLMQIAFNFAGAVHSGSAMITVVR